MPRPLVLGNGRTLITFDGDYAMRDLYYPHVGMLNQLCGHKNPLGLWADGEFSWVEPDEWDLSLRYEEETLVGSVEAVNARLGLRLHATDTVHFRDDIFVRRIEVHNLQPRPREVRLFFAYDFCVDQTDIGDTVLYDPSTDALIHYKRDRCFLMGGAVEEGAAPGLPEGGMRQGVSGDGRGIFQFAAGTKRFQGAEGTWRDAEDGVLEGNPIAQGSVDSTYSLRLHVPAGGRGVVHGWIVMGSGFEEVRALHGRVRERVPEIIAETRAYWRTWVNKHERDWADLSPEVVALFKRSLLIVRTQIDRGGAILAANDTDILQFNRDHYSYMWPRDGAFVAHALDRAGYSQITRTFYEFCADVLAPGGFFWHKYNPDGSVGSSWHPWIVNGDVQLPIQEDETALVLWALGGFYEADPDLEFVESLYEPLIRPAADFLVQYRDRRTGLPLDSHDLWEERRGVFTFTTAAVCAGLRAASRFAELLGRNEEAQRFREAAAEVLEAIRTHLYSAEHGRFMRGYVARGDGRLLPDATAESSVAGLFLLGVLPPGDPLMVSTMESLQRELWLSTPVGGMPRYYRDYYFSRGDDFERVPGNPWVICTLWLAQWHIARAQTVEELERAGNIFQWVLDRALPSGVLAEQFHPDDGRLLSVAPLTWSHSTFVHAVVDYLERHRSLRTGAPAAVLAGV